MSITHIKQTAQLDNLDASGEVGIPLTQPACMLHVKRVSVPGADNASTGVWECSPGRFRRQVERGEVMHILSGTCTFTPDGEPPMELEAGDTVFMSPQTNGIWDIKTTMRKVFTLL